GEAAELAPRVCASLALADAPAEVDDQRHVARRQLAPLRRARRMVDPADVLVRVGGNRRAGRGERDLEPHPALVVADEAHAPLLHRLTVDRRDAVGERPRSLFYKPTGGATPENCDRARHNA